MPELPIPLSKAAPVLELAGIRKSFNVGADNEIEVLHGIDMCLYPGDFCAVVGPSGSGKSTLLNTVGLLDRPSSGSLRITGLETTQLSDAQLTHLRGHSIGFVFQYHHLLSAFSALENVMMPMYAAQGWMDARMRARAAQLPPPRGLFCKFHRGKFARTDRRTRITLAPPRDRCSCERLHHRGFEFEARPCEVIRRQLTRSVHAKGVLPRWFGRDWRERTRDVFDARGAREILKQSEGHRKYGE